MSDRALIGLNPIDFANIERVLGPAPVDGPAVFTSSHDILPGRVSIAHEGEVTNVPMADFDPIAGAFLDAVEEYGVAALTAAPGGFLITTDEGNLLVTYSDNLPALIAASSLGIPIVDGDGNEVDPAAVLSIADTVGLPETMLAIAETDKAFLTDTEMGGAE